jgi:hypothetical protein
MSGNVGQHDRGVTDLDLRVSDFSVRLIETHQFLRAECPAIKVESLGGVLDNEIRRNRVISLRDGASSHESSSMASRFKWRSR